MLNQILDICNYGDDYSISMINGDNREPAEKWTLSIYNAQTGQVVYMQNTIDGGVTVNTSSWKPGIYVVQGQANGETVREKILIK